MTAPGGYPPIPDAVIAEAWSEFRYPRQQPTTPTPGFVRAVAAVNRWLTGMAVVPLPEPDNSDGNPTWTVAEHVSVEAEAEVRDGPSVWVNDAAYIPDDARKLAAALLSAAARAEQLAAAPPDAEL